MGSDITILIEKYLEGAATDAEREVVLSWYRSVDHSVIRIPLDEEYEMGGIHDRIRALLMQHIAATRVPSRRMPVYRWAAAAAVFLLLAAGWLWYARPFAHREQPAVAAQLPVGEHDVSPGHNGAILTLADGSKQVLDSLQNGVIATQGATKISLKDHQVSYAAAGDAAPVYNTMSTPRGREYQLVLPDGTRVWLNAASSLTYPTAFNGLERVVEMTGEAYFEVKHGYKPFRVKVNGETITDLGTRFNVNAYTDEPATVTTLIEGSVRVSDQVLTPGEQAAFTPQRSIRVSTCDTSVAMAWVNGRFSFHEVRLREL
ncbi:MAG: FecR domain-containing protein, partial [Bacteroidota bacterium]|nr:FecR domain-containing protein [Bacteroidota bacterium]